MHHVRRGGRPGGDGAEPPQRRGLQRGTNGVGTNGATAFLLAEGPVGYSREPTFIFHLPNLMLTPSIRNQRLHDDARGLVPGAPARGGMYISLSIHTYIYIYIYIYTYIHTQRSTRSYFKNRFLKIRTGSYFNNL